MVPLDFHCHFISVLSSHLKLFSVFYFVCVAIYIFKNRLEHIKKKNSKKKNNSYQIEITAVVYCSWYFIWVQDLLFCAGFFLSFYLFRLQRLSSCEYNIWMFSAAAAAATTASSSATMILFIILYCCNFYRKQQQQKN